jgi:hypothetical protein
MSPAELIKKSFLVCGISNALDCSEDEMINVIKPKGPLFDHRDLILSKLAKCDEADPESESTSDVESDHDECAVDESDSDESDDDAPLATLLA